MKIAIIGAGAAGCFTAINIKRLMPEADVTVFEGGRKPLAKVAITGGGRCNLTNSFAGIKNMGQVYPRGERLMKRLLREFSHIDAYDWFEREGVRLVTQSDECVFPQSQDAMQIVDTLLTLMKRNGARIKTEHKVVAIRKTGEGFSLSFADNGKPQVEADIVVVTIGGCPRDADLGLIEGLDIETVSPMPSLFSLRISDNSLTALMGTVVENTSASLCGTKFKSAGPLLITHWGVSGPAILKLSSYAARHLGECGYKAHLAVNWLGCDNEEKTRELIAALGAQNRLKRVGNIYPTQLNARLWAHLLGRAGIETDTRWVDLSKKSVNKLVSTLISDTYAVDGKNRFKDEFVTSGGVALVGIDHKTLECRGCRNMYFAGEVLDVDAVTGGFNLQAAWTMGFVVAKSIAQKQHTNI